MTEITDYILPIIVTIIIILGAVKGFKVFEVFLIGAKSGFKTILEITPSLIALILSVNMLKESGGLEILKSMMQPVSSFLNIPNEIMPLTILSPISGSGAITMFESILKDLGPDSFVGRCASVMMGSTETTFYAITLYYGSCNIKNSRHTLPSAICADLTSFIFSVKTVGWFL